MAAAVVVAAVVVIAAKSNNNRRWVKPNAAAAPKHRLQDMAEITFLDSKNLLLRLEYDFASVPLCHFPKYQQVYELQPGHNSKRIQLHHMAKAMVPETSVHSSLHVIAAQH